MKAYNESENPYFTNRAAEAKASVTEVTKPTEALNDGDKLRFKRMSMHVPGGAFAARKDTETVEDVILYAHTLSDALGFYMRKAAYLEDGVRALEREREVVRNFFTGTTEEE